MTYTKQDCLDALENFYKSHERTPTSREWGEKGCKPSYGTFYRLFDSWGDAISQAGLEANDTKNRKAVNVDYFKSIDTPEKAYWLGMLYGDGCITTRGGNNQLVLELTDMDLVYEFREAVESEHKVAINRRSGNHSDSARIAIGIGEFIDPLIAKGMDSNKTTSTTLPDLDESLRSHFVRGLYDADGHLSNRNWEICGSSEERFEVISEWLPVSSNIYADSRDGRDQFTLKAGKKKWNKISNWLYPDGTDTSPMLERKFVQ